MSVGCYTLCCVHASSVNMLKERTDKYLVNAGYTYRPVKLWFDPKQIATETISPVLIQEISPEHHIKNII